MPPGPPPGPPQGYQAPPGGYAPPPPGYGPPQPGYGPPAPAAGPSSFDMSKVGTGDWIVLGIGVLMLIFSFFGWVSFSYGFGSTSIGGWNSWWIIIQLLLLVIVVIRAVQIFTGQLVKEISPVYLVYGAALLVVLSIIALIHIFASYSTSASDACRGETGASLTACQAALGDTGSGPGFGIWAYLILSLGFLYFMALSAQAKGAKLPFAVPGPKL